MHTLLFDIDGTLIRTGGAGFRAIRQAMNGMFGFSEIPDVEVHGRTDHEILTTLFEKCGLDYGQHGEPLSHLYWQHLPTALLENDGEVLPGVSELLASISQRHEFALGILTGNARRAAEIKLRHFELRSFFHFGGYGDDHACRNDVAKMAVESAAQFLGGRFDASKVWVIGDTVNDIRCARSIGSRVIAVETGGSTPDELRAATPDAQLAKFDLANFFQLFD